jgi:hypothetical protein
LRVPATSGFNEFGEILLGEHPMLALAALAYQNIADVAGRNVVAQGLLGEAEFAGRFSWREQAHGRCRKSLNMSGALAHQKVPS